MDTSEEFDYYSNRCGRADVAQSTIQPHARISQTHLNMTPGGGMFTRTSNDPNP
jgi:hypothetical protein